VSFEAADTCAAELMECLSCESFASSSPITPWTAVAGKPLGRVGADAEIAGHDLEFVLGERGQAIARGSAVVDRRLLGGGERLVSGGDLVVDGAGHGDEQKVECARRACLPSDCSNRTERGSRRKRSLR